MTFVVNAIKQDPQNIQKPQNVQFLLVVDSPLFARKIIEKSSLILLSLNDYSSEPKSFGSVYVSFVFEAKTVIVVGQKSFTLKDLCLFFLNLGFDVTDGNYFVEPQSPEQIKKVLDVCKKELEEGKKLAQISLQKQQAAEKNTYYQDDGLEKAKGVIAWSLDKVNSLLQDKGAFVSAKDLRTIKDKVEELKKLRMGTNYEKIRDMLQDLFSLVDRIEEEYYASLEDNSDSLFSGTSVTSVDLERQLSILEKVHQQQLFGGSVPTQRKDYVAFGQNLVYIYFLKKDLSQIFQSILLLFYRIFDFIQIGILFTLIVLGLSIVYFALVSPEYSLFSIYSSFFSLGLLGLFSYFFSYIKTKNPLFVVLLLISMFILYFISLPFLKHSFALS